MFVCVRVQFLEFFSSRSPLFDSFLVWTATTLDAFTSTPVIFEKQKQNKEKSE